MVLSILYRSSSIRPWFYQLCTDTMQYVHGFINFVQIQFNTSMVINGISTQGRFYNANDTCCNFDERVTKYTTSYSDDCSTFTSIFDTDGHIKVCFPYVLPILASGLHEMGSLRPDGA